MLHDLHEDYFKQAAKNAELISQIEYYNLMDHIFNNDEELLIKLNKQSKQRKE